MILRFPLILSVFLCSLCVNAQQAALTNRIPVEGEKCLTDHFMHSKMQDPIFAQSREQADQVTRNYIDMAEAARGNGDEEVYTIPVVFHVIHKGEAVGTGTNISTAQLESAIDALNRDFAASSQDGGVAQSSESTAAGNTYIEFCLASVDPNGNPTSGINRVNGSNVFQYSEQGITDNNEFAVKSLSRWNNEHYLNIWVVSEIENNNGDAPNPGFFSGGTLGYAYFPTYPVSVNSSLDGIVVVNVCVGNDPDGDEGYRLWSNTVLNRTLTHEAGHFLNLRHTFTGGSCDEFNCSFQGDLVCDTPPTVLNSNCSYPACNGNQLVENYLDYSGEDCVEMFTSGQKSRMRGALEGLRSELVNTSNCGAASPSNPPNANFSANTTSVTEGESVTFTDQSTSNPTSWQWNISPGSAGNHWTYASGSSSSSENPVVIFNTPGNYSISLTASNSDGSDIETKNQYISVSPELIEAQFYAAPTSVMEGETVAFTDQSTQNTSSWQWNISPGTAGNQWSYANGSSSSSENPVVIFNTAGNYSVSLTASFANGSDVETKSNYISVAPAPLEENCHNRLTTVRLYVTGTSILVAEYSAVVNMNEDELILANVVNATGIFDVFVKPDGYLQKGFPAMSVLSEAISLSSGDWKKGDINNSNGINITDLSILSNAFNTSEGDELFAPNADLNCDGGINITDITTLGSNFNLQGDVPPLNW